MKKFKFGIISFVVSRVRVCRKVWVIILLIMKREYRKEVKMKF